MLLTEITPDTVLPIEEGKRAFDFLVKASQDLEAASFSNIVSATQSLAKWGIPGGPFTPFSMPIYRGVILKQDDVSAVRNVSRLSYRKKPKGATTELYFNRSSTI